MKSGIHPSYKPLKVICSCGNVFETRSSVGKDVLNIEICAACHPFYTGKQKIVDTAGRVEKFQKRYTAKPMPAEKSPRTTVATKNPTKTKPMAKKSVKSEVKSKK